MWLLCVWIFGELGCHCPEPENGLKKVARDGKFSSFIIDIWLIYPGVDFFKQCEIGSQATMQRAFIWPYYTNDVNCSFIPIFLSICENIEVVSHILHLRWQTLVVDTYSLQFAPLQSSDTVKIWYSLISLENP